MTKKIVACVLAAALIIVLIGVSTAEFRDDDALYVDDVGTKSQIDEQKIYDELFDPNSVVRIEIDISNNELAKIQNDYEHYKSNGSKSPIYRKADSVTFIINGKKYVIEEVGMRMKGNETRTNFYNDILGVYNLVNFRLSFNETFDDADYYIVDSKKWNSDKERSLRKKRTFATLDDIEIKWNSSLDNTYVRNTYVSDMFKAYDVPAQNCRLASVRAGTYELGVYKIFEPVDDIFIQRYFSEQDSGGDLYKSNWAYGQPANCTLDNTYGVPDKEKGVFYNFELKTNKTDPQHVYLKRFLRVINDENLTKNKLEEVLDVDSFLRFCALNYLMGNQDDLRNNYNNYYLYFRPSDGKAVFIPYDCERCLGCVYNWDPTGSAMTEVSPYSDMAEGAQLEQVNNLINFTVGSNGNYKEEYTEYLREIASSKWMTESNYRSYYDTAQKNYEEYADYAYLYLSANGRNLDFSMEGGEGYNDNMAVPEFMRKIKNTMYKYVS